MKVQKYEKDSSGPQRSPRVKNQNKITKAKFKSGPMGAKKGPMEKKKMMDQKFGKDSSGFQQGVKTKNYKVMKAKSMSNQKKNQKGHFVKKKMFDQRRENNSSGPGVKNKNFKSTKANFKSGPFGKKKFSEHKEGKSETTTPYNKKGNKNTPFKGNKNTPFKGNKNTPFKGNKHENKNLTEKTGLKRKLESDDVSSPDKSIKLCTLKKKERKIVRQKSENKEAFELGKTLKLIWEELRKEKCEPAAKEKLLKKASELIKGHTKELIFAHDTVRVIECIVALGTETHRTQIFEELKEEIIPLAKSKYAKFFLIKLLRYGTKPQKNYIMKAFHSKVMHLISHTEAAAVVEVAFNECANAVERSELVQEFYGPSFRFFKSEGALNLKQIIGKDAELKGPIIKHMREVINKLLQKSVFRHSIVHFAVQEFMHYADQQSRAEIIESLRNIVVEMVHTKEGSRIAMSCLWHGTAKDRKAIIKSFKTHVSKIAKEEFGHRVLLALFDSVDDTKFVEKYIITELVSDILEISQNLYGKKVLIYLLCPRDSCHFHPDIIKMLQQGDGNITSKKDSAIRRAELKQAITAPLLQLIIDNIGNEKCYSDNSFCLFVATILKHSEGGSRVEAFKSIANLVAEKYDPLTKLAHAIESPGYNFMLKKLIAEDKAANKDKEESFSEVLISEIPKGVMKLWIHCNRGSFLLLNLLETELPSVVQRVKAEMNGQLTQLAKKQFKGAELLLQRLKK